MRAEFLVLHRALITGVCIAVLGTVACSHKTDVRTSPFPDSNEVAGWVRSGDMRTFSADDLWKYIDGDAERYLKAGVWSVSTADYKFRDKYDAVADIYTLESSSGAAKIFESEPAADSQSAHLGDESRLFGQSLIFRRGPSIVRITAYQASPETQADLLALGKGIEQRLSR